MRFQQKTILGRLILGIFLVGLIAGCSINENTAFPYVQNMVQQEPASWHLSPMGDRLLYDITASRGRAIVRVLTTDQEFTIENCSLFSWLDNEHVYCYDFYNNNYKPFVATIDVSANSDNIQKLLIKEASTEQVELESLLKQAKAIYRLRPSRDESGLLLIQNSENENQFYQITRIKNLNQVLKKYPYTEVPLYSRYGELSQKIYSPNRKYYYLLQDNLGVYDATTDQLLAEFVPPPKYRSWFQFGGNVPNKTEGWGEDNSGVYFRIVHSGGFGPPPPIRPIQKLCVPASPGCPSAN